jgi:hypothetical protein
MSPNDRPLAIVLVFGDGLLYDQFAKLKKEDKVKPEEPGVPMKAARPPPGKYSKENANDRSSLCFSFL